MARVFFALLIVIAAFTQTIVLPQLHLLGVVPDLVLVLLLLWSGMRGVAEGALWVFGTGILLDLLAMDRLGTNGLALLVVAVLAGQSRRRFFHSGLVFPIALAVIATLAHAMILLIVRDAGAELPLASASRLIILQALLNSLLVPPLYLLAASMDRHVVQSYG